MFVATPDREPSSDVAGRADDKYGERMGERLPDDHVVWTDSMEPTGYRVVVGGIHFVVSARMFDSVNVGDDVTLTAEGGRWGEIARASNVAQGKSSVAMTTAEFRTRPPETQLKGSASGPDPGALAIVDTLRWHGVDARLMGRDGSSAPNDYGIPPDRIEILEGPIRWIQAGPLLWVPDTRIGPGYPHVFVIPGRDGRWESEEADYEGLMFEDGLDVPLDRAFSSEVANYLNETIPGIYSAVQSHLTDGCWVIDCPVSLVYAAWNQQLAIANALLEMPRRVQQ
jgi:hypothetical protein